MNGMANPEGAFDASDLQSSRPPLLHQQNAYKLIIDVFNRGKICGREDIAGWVFCFVS